MHASDHVKQNSDELAIIVTDITNACLAEGTMPTELKQALVHPLHKKPSLCKDTLSNHRPVSNLSQLSKVIKKVVANRLNIYLVNKSLTETFQ